MCIATCALSLWRPGELRTAEWADIDLNTSEWRFTASKTGTPHIEPLATQAVAILRELHNLTGGGRFVFLGMRTLNHKYLFMVEISIFDYRLWFTSSTISSDRRLLNAAEAVEIKSMLWLVWTSGNLY